MSNLFDELEDETPPSIGQEIGDVLSGALAQIGEANKGFASMLAKAISDGMKAIESRNIVLHENKLEPVKKWTFKLKRSKNGLLEEIVAEAE